MSLSPLPTNATQTVLQRTTTSALLIDAATRCLLGICNCQFFVFLCIRRATCIQQPQQHTLNASPVQSPSVLPSRCHAVDRLSRFPHKYSCSIKQKDTDASYILAQAKQANYSQVATCGLLRFLIQLAEFEKNI